MRVEHVPGGGGAAYAFLRLDDFLVRLLFHVVSYFLSFSSLSTLFAIQYHRFSKIQFATQTLTNSTPKPEKTHRQRMLKVIS